jgi:hypothetical protein
MGFTSQDDFINKVTNNGQFLRQDINKVTGGTAFAAGRWYDMGAMAGYPVANAWAGTALTWKGCDEATGNGTQIFGMPHGGNVSPATKHIINVSAVTGVATGVPAQLMLVDLQGYYPGISLNSATAQTLLGTPTLRYADGAGCKLFGVITTAAGATAHNISLSYTNQAGVAGKALPVTVSATASAIAGHITHSGTAANNYAPFLPLAGGDSGVRSVQTVTISAASGAGVMALCLARPLLTIPITTLGVAAERDLVNQLPSMPRVYDGACLQWLYFAGAATAAATGFNVSADFAWG